MGLRPTPTGFSGGPHESVRRADSMSERTGTDVGAGVGGDSGGIRTVARDGAPTGATEHRRAGVSFPVRPIRAVDLSA